MSINLLAADLQHFDGRVKHQHELVNHPCSGFICFNRPKTSQKKYAEKPVTEHEAEASLVILQSHPKKISSVRTPSLGGWYLKKGLPFWKV
jgi:hypothetical protein